MISKRKLAAIVRGASVALGLLALPTIAFAEGPAFKIDPFWPKDMPNNWTMGQIAGVSIDEQDHIWVLQRPRSLTKDEAGAAAAFARGRAGPSNLPQCREPCRRGGGGLRESPAAIADYRID